MKENLTHVFRHYQLTHVLGTVSDVQPSHREFRSGGRRNGRGERGIQKNARYENVPCVKPYIMSDVQIIVIRLGLEPKTHTLKVYCSTS